jgi:hypothetical protein
MRITLVGYLVFVRNERILIGLVDNSSYYNKVHTKHVEVLEGNQYNDFSIILANSGAKKLVAINFDAKIPMNLLSKTPFHSIVSTKFVPPNSRKEPSRRCCSNNFVTYNTLFQTFQETIELS